MGKNTYIVSVPYLGKKEIYDSLRDAVKRARQLSRWLDSATAVFVIGNKTIMLAAKNGSII